jgi:hypothetical protein
LPSKRKIGETIPYRIAIVFIVLGAISLVFSVYHYQESQILAFIGLGLAFWGVLFLFLRPVKYVKGSLLASAATSEYLTINEMIKKFQYKANAYYVPPFPNKGQFPEHLKDLKEPVVFISAENETEKPSIEKGTERNFLLTKQKGMFIIPPGLGLLTEMEKKLRLDFTTMKLSDLCEIIPRLIVEEYNLAKAMNITLSGNKVNLRMVDSLYENLYHTKNDTQSISTFGCPIISAVACALAKSSGKLVTIQKPLVSLDGLTILAEYNLGQG